MKIKEKTVSLKDLPEQFKDLIPGRERFNNIQVFKGGRGGGKSFSIPYFIIIRCLAEDNTRWVCGRVLKTQSDLSMKNLFSDTINDLLKRGWEGINLYKINNKGLEFHNGSTIIFTGIGDNTIDNIKSISMVGCWIDECVSIKKDTLDILLRSIRTGKNTTLILSYNPQFLNDQIIEWTKMNNGKIVTTNYYDNPYFNSNESLVKYLKNDESKVTTGEMTQEEFNHIWKGQPYLDSNNLVLSAILLEKVLKEQLDIKSNWEHYTLKMGIDVARGGDDYSVIAVRQGVKMLHLSRYKNKDGYELAMEIMNIKNNLNVDYVFIDVIGVGASVYDVLRHHYKQPIFGINVANATKNTPYLNLRAQMYFRLKEFISDFTLDISLINNELRDELIKQMQFIPYKYNEMNKLQILKKELIKESLGKSPDELEAIALTFAMDDVPELKMSNNFKRQNTINNNNNNNNNNSDSWIKNFG
jgi:PBSX family phage terminase large subunit